MSHKPDRSPTMGARTTGNLSKRKAAGNQSMNKGGRYSPLQKMVEADSKKALKKAQKLKAGTTETGQRSEPVILNPDKNIIAQGVN